MSKKPVGEGRTPRAGKPTIPRSAPSAGFERVKKSGDGRLSSRARRSRFAGATKFWGEVRKGGGAPLRVSDHAYIPAEAMGILTARTLGNSHPVLLRLLRPGMSVLDVGCGPGTVTAEIARRVAPGHVVGMDINPEMTRAAEESSPPGEVPNLLFYTGDVCTSGWDGEFDIVNAARALQWIRDPELALGRMARAITPGGRVVVLDFDHTLATWSDPPREWTRFYDAFLAWRAAGGLDNAIAKHLPALLQSAGLVAIKRTPQVTTVRAGDADFFRVAGLWRMVIESRGRQMVAASHLTEPEREAAFAAYTEWMKSEGATHTVHEACVIGRRPPA
jgi:ubiquinone/menaquinone biosynthesis C-methylase UbiE